MARPKCYYPKEGFRYEKIGNVKVKVPCMRPCGSCIGCRLEKARQWAMRCVHESQMHEDNLFITLTYNNESLPYYEINGKLVPTLCKEDFQRFMKRLRKHLEYPGSFPLFDKAMRIQYYRKKGHKKYGEPKPDVSRKEVRFYACGEYGSKLGRPHYHCILFGHRFQDQTVLYQGHIREYKNKFKKSMADNTLYRSETLEKLWPYGYVTIGEVTFESAGYVARYCTKKITGEKRFQHYKGKEPEFALMSRMPGIGRPWLDKYFTDCYPKDYTTLRGVKMQPPRYYDEVLEQKNPKLLEKLKIKRRQHLFDNRPEDRIREERFIKSITNKTLIRSLENEES